MICLLPSLVISFTYSFSLSSPSDTNISRTRKKETGPSIVWLWIKYEHLSCVYLHSNDKQGVGVTMDKNKRDME